MRLASLGTLLVAVTAMITSVAQAGEQKTCCCMCGKKVCVLEVSKEEEEVTCFQVESKEICIPGIRLPWDKCGTRRCGGVRKVCVLSEDKKEKTVCKYDWSIKTICTTCCQHHGFKHKHRHAQTNQDDKVPFEYYVAEPENVAEPKNENAASDADRVAAQVLTASASEEAPAARTPRAVVWLIKPFTFKQ